VGGYDPSVNGYRCVCGGYWNLYSGAELVHRDPYVPTQQNVRAALPRVPADLPILDRKHLIALIEVLPTIQHDGVAYVNHTAVLLALRATAARVPEPDLEPLIAFIDEQRTRAEQARRARIDESETWRTGSDEDFEAGRLMAERQSGRAMASKSAAEREEIAHRADRIAAKYQREVELFDAIKSALRAARAGAEAPPGEVR
jgi:hypothetical protein